MTAEERHEAWLYERSCMFKAQFATKEQAKRALRRMGAHGFNPTALNVYRCPFCRTSWHIGHKSKERKEV